MFFARFDKQDEDDQIVDEIEITKVLKKNQNLTQSAFDIFNTRSHLERQIQNQEDLVLEFL